MCYVLENNQWQAERGSQLPPWSWLFSLNLKSCRIHELKLQLCSFIKELQTFLIFIYSILLSLLTVTGLKWDLLSAWECHLSAPHTHLECPLWQIHSLNPFHCLFSKILDNRHQLWCKFNKQKKQIYKQ